MKKFLTGFFMICLSVVLVACGANNQGNNQENKGNVANNGVEEQETATKDSKILIAYYSRTGNTEKVANLVGEKMGGDMFKIEPTEAYPEDEDETKARLVEETEAKARPEYDGEVESFDDYDVIFLGYPIWNGDVPPTVKTFLEAHNFEGKKVVPFATFGGGGLGDSVQSVGDLATGGELLQEFGIPGAEVDASKDQISDWLEALPIE
ncbi:MAG: flavodoxin [Tissierellia bacterium]|nr:flavodoxin [Tissierellia bacterium]